MAKVKKQLSNALLPWRCRCCWWWCGRLPHRLAGCRRASCPRRRILSSPSGISRPAVSWQHLAISGWRAAIGFAIGGSIGLILGLITGTSRTGERLLDTSVQMLRNVPHRR